MTLHPAVRLDNLRRIGGTQRRLRNEGVRYNAIGATSCCSA